MNKVEQSFYACIFSGLLVNKKFWGFFGCLCKLECLALSQFSVCICVCVCVIFIICYKYVRLKTMYVLLKIYNLKLWEMF